MSTVLIQANIDSIIRSITPLRILQVPGSIASIQTLVSEGYAFQITGHVSFADAGRIRRRFKRNKLPSRVPTVNPVRTTLVLVETDLEFLSAQNAAARFLWMTDSVRALIERRDIRFEKGGRSIVPVESWSEIRKALLQMNIKPA